MAGTEFIWKGRFGPLPLRISETTFEPSTISTLVADALEVNEGDTVIDIGCGSGILSIIAAKLGAGRVFAVDKSPDVEEIGAANAEANGVGDKITFASGSLFEPIPEEIDADVIIGDVSGIPDDLADYSGWFPTKGGGGTRGSEVPITMLEQAVKRLKPTGKLFLPTGTLQDETAILAVARNLYGKVRQLSERIIPLPSKLAESSVVKDLMERGIIELTTRGSRFLWEARVWEITPSR